MLANGCKMTTIARLCLDVTTVIGYIIAPTPLFIIRYSYVVIMFVNTYQYMTIVIRLFQWNIRLVDHMDLSRGASATCPR